MTQNTATGVRIMPGNTAGYLFDGVHVSYQQVRIALEHYAKHFPEMREEMASQARAINRAHLRRVLEAEVRRVGGVRAWKRLHRWSLENMPRAKRRLFGNLTSSITYRTHGIGNVFQPVSE